MPFEYPDIRMYNGGIFMSAPIILVGSAVTDGSGRARFYLTSDGTATGNAIFNNVYTWVSDVEALTPATTRTMASGVNYIEATVTTLTFTGIVLLGIPVLGSVANTPAVGITVRFLVVGD